ncbi:MAG: LysM peptidoglycan-binding domain-containing protein, partial [Candidatus Lutibacillus vidarii]
MTVLTSATRWAPYVVRTGDTLWDIAQRTHTTVGTLVAHNRLPNGGAHLVPGQVLQVPSSASTARPRGTAAPRPVPSRTYVVRRGDTLTAIAARFRVPVGSLAHANRMSNPHLIRVGQR